MKASDKEVLRWLFLAMIIACIVFMTCEFSFFANDTGWELIQHHVDQGSWLARLAKAAVVLTLAVGCYGVLHVSYYKRFPRR